MSKTSEQTSLQKRDIQMVNKQMKDAQHDMPLEK